MAQAHDTPPNPEGGATKSRESSPWWRIPYLVLFVVIFEVCKSIVYLTALVQLVLRIATGKPNERLRRFGGGMGRYLREIVAYLTYSSDAAPYPFGSWPQG
jgi:hypothetical protein